MPSLVTRSFVEFLGTFWLVFGGCGSALLAATAPAVGIGWLGVSIAFGLTLLTIAYALGSISGAHLNPAVSVAFAASGRFSARDLPAYIGAQLLGAIAGAGVLYVIARGQAGFVLGTGWPANGFAAHSPGGYSLGASFAAELVLTFFFVLVVLGVTAQPSLTGFAPLAVGLALTLVHLIGIPVTNTSVNPARSTGPAIFVGGWALQQLWLFWVAPLAGGVLAAAVHRALTAERVTADRPVRQSRAA